MKKCNAVFEGGGVRGIGHVGAACGMEYAGYEFVNLAGSSAGAIVAALLAAGYTCRELKEEMEALDYTKFRGKDFADRFGMAGKAVSLCLNLGIYHTDYLESWIGGLLKQKNMSSFGDIGQTGRMLKITASDLTDRRLIILPDAAAEFGTEPEKLSIASAVRMSVSIPVFFEPVRWRDKSGKEHLIVDGGLLSNYPVWVLDDGKNPPMRPTFGFRFTDERTTPCSRAYPAAANIADYLKSIVDTCMDAIDNSRIEEGDYERTIRIPTIVGKGSDAHKISSVDFDICAEDSRALFENGRAAVGRFLKGWNFERWKRRYRKG